MHFTKVHSLNSAKKVQKATHAMHFTKEILNYFSTTVTGALPWTLILSVLLSVLSPVSLDYSSIYFNSSPNTANISWNPRYYRQYRTHAALESLALPNNLNAIKSLHRYTRQKKMNMAMFKCKLCTVLSRCKNSLQIMIKIAMHFVYRDWHSWAVASKSFIVRHLKWVT